MNNQYNRQELSLYLMAYGYYTEQELDAMNSKDMIYALESLQEIDQDQEFNKITQ